MNSQNRIEICGGIASGKTTLAHALEETGYSAVYESFRSNPFFELFYADPPKYAFETEITFHLQRYSQFRDAALEGPDKLYVCDSALIQDLAYAKVNLTGSMLSTFQRVYEEVTSILPPPSLLIRLNCSPEEELRRIKNRARVEEANIQISYLSQLNRSVLEQFEELKPKIKFLEIDSEQLNFADNSDHQRQVINRITSFLD